MRERLGGGVRRAQPRQVRLEPVVVDGGGLQGVVVVIVPSVRSPSLRCESGSGLCVRQRVTVTVTDDVRLDRAEPHDAHRCPRGRLQRGLDPRPDARPPAARRSPTSVDHVLVCDDASADETYEVGLGYRRRLAPAAHGRSSTRENLGYGGNQKAGYHWAIEHGLDVVVLLHGDGQYAPEVIESIVEPLVRGEADAVFGSRMMERGKARAGGMPLYKYVGNRILSTLPEPRHRARRSPSGTAATAPTASTP